MVCILPKGFQRQGLQDTRPPPDVLERHKIPTWNDGPKPRRNVKKFTLGHHKRKELLYLLEGTNRKPLTEFLKEVYWDKTDKPSFPQKEVSRHRNPTTEVTLSETNRGTLPKRSTVVRRNKRAPGVSRTNCPDI